MIRHQRAWLLLFLFSSFFAATPAAVAKWKYRVTPQFRLNTLYYPKEITGTEQLRYSLRSELFANYRWKRWFKFVLQPVVEVDPSANKAASPVTPKEDFSERLYWDLREAYFLFRFRPFSLQVGNSIYSWGVTDGFSPTDVVNPRRYVSPLAAEKLGTPAINLSWIAGDFDAELVFIPIQRRSILPGEDSRWLPRNIYVSRGFADQKIILDQNLRYYYREHEELDDALKSNFGARLRGQVGPVDLSAMYFEGFSPSPSINLALSGGTIIGSNEIRVDPDVGLTPVYYKRRVMGGTAVVTLFDEFILRLESAFTNQISTATNKALPGDYSEHVVSLEHDFPVGDNVITTVLQGTYGDYESNTENGTASLSRVFERGAVLGLRYAPSRKWTFVSTFLWDTLRKGYVTVFNTEHKIKDQLSASFTASFIAGAGDTPLGTYKDNDLLALTLRYDF